MAMKMTPKKAMAESNCPDSGEQKPGFEVSTPKTTGKSAEIKTDATSEGPMGGGSPSLSVHSPAASTTSPSPPTQIPLPDNDVFWTAVLSRGRSTKSGLASTTDTVDVAGLAGKTDTAQKAGTEGDTAQGAGVEGMGSNASSVPATPKARYSPAPAIVNLELPNDAEGPTPNSKRGSSFLNPEAKTFLPLTGSPSYFSRDFTLPDVDSVSQINLSDHNLPGVGLPIPKITLTPHKSKMAIKTTSYHIDADLAVKVQGPHGLQIFKVHSALFAAASPIWRQKIYGGEYARPKTGEWVISMRDADDSAAGLDILFSLIHYKFYEIPARPDMNLFYGIAQVANKYSCVHLLVPYTTKWTEALNGLMVTMDESNMEPEKVLFITWVFGEPRWFAHSISRVAYRATLDLNSGALLSSDGIPCEKYGLPASLIDVIAKTRTNAISKMLSTLNASLEGLLDASEQENTTCCHSKEAADEIKEQCQMLQLGSLIRGLTKAKMMPVPRVDEYKGSAISLAEELDGIKVSRYKVPGIRPQGDSHATCGFRGKDAMGKAMPAVADLTGEIIQLLKGKSIRSGAYNADTFGELTNSVCDPKDEADSSTYLSSVDDPVSDRIHYKQEEGYSMSSDGLDPIVEEDGTDQSNGVTTPEVIPVTGTDDNSTATNEEGFEVRVKENVGTLEPTDEGSLAVDTSEEVAGKPVEDQSRDDKILRGKAGTKTKCPYCTCNDTSYEESEESVMIKTEDSVVLKMEDLEFA